MDILYVCNEKMERSFNVDAILNKKSIINNIEPYVIDSSVNSENFQQLNNNLLFGNTREIMVIK